MQEIKLGDIVTLKSDPSVKMTVGSYVPGTNHVLCFYFLNSEIRHFQISKEALDKVS